MTSELRKDPVTGRWVIIAGERGRRPNPFRCHPLPEEGGEACPFCPGHEGMTPPEVLAYRDPDDGANAPERIANFIKERHHNLLFIGAYGHSRIIEMVLGSTTEYVLRNAPCPVFLNR